MLSCLYRLVVYATSCNSRQNKKIKIIYILLTKYLDPIKNVLKFTCQKITFQHTTFCFVNIITKKCVQYVWLSIYSTYLGALTHKAN